MGGELNLDRITLAAPVLSLQLSRNPYAAPGLRVLDTAWN
jgi:hypothetical protein